MRHRPCTADPSFYTVLPHTALPYHRLTVPLSPPYPCPPCTAPTRTALTEVIYVAGDRVVTDALCKPFSMGRNLFCVHSKVCGVVCAGRCWVGGCWVLGAAPAVPPSHPPVQRPPPVTTALTRCPPRTAPHLPTHCTHTVPRTPPRTTPRTPPRPATEAH